MTPSGLTHGADTDRLEDIATQLLASAQRVGAVGATGTASAPVLEEAWAGGDCEAFIGSWQSARQMVEHTETHLRAFAALLLEQAAQQDAASGGAPASTGADRPSPSPQAPKGGSSGGGKGLGDDSTDRGPENGPGQVAHISAAAPTPVQEGGRRWDPASLVVNHYRHAFKSWSESDLTYFERLFVPWGAPTSVQQDYLRGADLATDWANEQWVDHVSDWGPTNFVQTSLKGWTGALDAAHTFTKPLDALNIAPVTGFNTGLEMVSDELKSYDAMLENPKQWWSEAGTLEQFGLVATAIPTGGIAVKGITKAAKRVIDLLTGAGKHGDEVAKHADDVGKHGDGADGTQPSPHVAWEDDLSEAAKLKHSQDSLERGYGENAEYAQELLQKHNITKPEDVWTLGNSPRGLIIEALNKGNLPPGFKGVDRLETVDGVDRVVSTKTMDASLPTYAGKPSAVESKLNLYLRSLDNFSSEQHISKTGNQVRIRESDYDQKVLEVVFRPDSLDADGWKAVERVRSRAKEMGIELEVSEYP